MAKYAPLAFLSEDEVPRHRGDLVFRQRRWTKVLGLGVFCLLSAGFLVGPTVFAGWDIWDEIPAWFAYTLGGFLALFVLIAWHAARASFRASSWRLRAADRGLYVKFRSFLNYGLAVSDPVVVLIPKQEIVSIRAHKIWARRPGTDDSEVIQRMTFLEITLHDEDLSELIEQLRRERAIDPGRSSGVAMIARHYPLRCLPGGVVQVDWSGLTPGLNRALDMLGRSYPVVDAKQTKQPRFSELDRVAKEDRLLELAERGEKIGAVKLAKELYGYDTTQATNFVNDLALR